MLKENVGGILFELYGYINHERKTETQNVKLYGQGETC